MHGFWVGPAGLSPQGQPAMTGTVVPLVLPSSLPSSLSGATCTPDLESLLKDHCGSDAHARCPAPTQEGHPRLPNCA